MLPLDSQGNWFAADAEFAPAAVASAARTATGTSAPFATDDIASLEAAVTITAASGTTPTLDLSLESSTDGTHWYSVAAFTQKTGAATDARVFGPLGDQARWKWTIGGTTPSFTFSIAAEANR